MPELKKALGTEVDVTVFRKLRQLAYRTRYSHRGSYYTLDESARFDQSGLWSFQSVWFSRWGTLLDTAEAFVGSSPAGHFVEELDNLLHVGTKEPLLKLVQHERMARQPVGGLYLYCSMDPVLRDRQLLARRVLQTEPGLAGSLVGAELAPGEWKASIVLFFSMLNEKQRVCTLGWSRSNSATAGISRWPGSSAWTRTRWPRTGANYSNKILK